MTVWHYITGVNLLVQSFKKTDIYYAHINDLTRRLLPKMAYMEGSFQKRHLFHFTFLGNCPPTPPLTNINT